jgi:hypothetical protein
MLVLKQNLLYCDVLMVRLSWPAYQLALGPTSPVKCSLVGKNLNSYRKHL